MKTIAVVNIPFADSNSIVLSVSDDHYEDAVTSIKTYVPLYDETYHRIHDGYEEDFMWNLDTVITNGFAFPYERHTSLPENVDITFDYFELVGLYREEWVVAEIEDGEITNVLNWFDTKELALQHATPGQMVAREIFNKMKNTCSYFDEVFV